MAWLRDVPIRRKLVIVIMLATTLGLVTATTALMAWDILRFRADLREDLTALALIAADNSTAALQFRVPRDAEEVLSSLDAKPYITGAAVYDADGRLFAWYAAPGSQQLPKTAPHDGFRSTASGVEVAQPIVLDRQRIGTVYLKGSFAGLYDRVRNRAMTTTLILVAAALLSLLLSARLQRLIADPVLQLAETARTVTARGDYSLRAPEVGRDEVGLLVSAFNDMLSQIERRDADLIAAKNTLEQRVRERTSQLQKELTERQRAEAELAERNVALELTNRELDDFAYIASHDLKEPLRGIHNYSRFLLEDYGDRLDTDARDKLETLGRLSRRMENLIDSLLHYSRLGRVDLMRERVDVQAVVDDVLDRLAISLRERGVAIRQPGPLPTVMADRVRLGELYANLITNAMKYNDKNNPWIEIGVRDDAPGGPVFYVRDNGIGIPERHHDTVFRIFKRLHGRDQFGGGTGAGLTIVRKIVERHHGRVWIESMPGEGTTVLFTLQEGA
jgi:signal transduction histidine kinase